MNIKSTSNKCCDSLGPVTPVKYEHESKYVNYSPEKSTFSQTDKWTNQSLVTPTPGQKIRKHKRWQPPFKLNMQSPSQKEQHLADNSFKCVYKSFYLFEYSLNFVHLDPVDKKSSVLQIMAWCQAGHKPLPELMLTWCPSHKQYFHQIRNSMKFCIGLVLNKFNRSQRNFAHVTTVTLSWHVQNFIVIGWPYFKSEHCFFFFLSAFISPFTWSCHNTIHTLHIDIDVAVDNGI